MQFDFTDTNCMLHCKQISYLENAFELHNVSNTQISTPPVHSQCVHFSPSTHNVFSFLIYPSTKSVLIFFMDTLILSSTIT